MRQSRPSRHEARSGPEHCFPPASESLDPAASVDLLWPAIRSAANAELKRQGTCDRPLGSGRRSRRGARRGARRVRSPCGYEREGSAEEAEVESSASLRESLKEERPTRVCSVHKRGEWSPHCPPQGPQQRRVRARRRAPGGAIGAAPSSPSRVLPLDPAPSPRANPGQRSSEQSSLLHLYSRTYSHPHRARSARQPSRSRRLERLPNNPLRLLIAACSHGEPRRECGHQPLDQPVLGSAEPHRRPGHRDRGRVGTRSVPPSRRAWWGERGDSKRARGHAAQHQAFDIRLGTCVGNVATLSLALAARPVLSTRLDGH